MFQYRFRVSGPELVDCGASWSNYEIRLSWDSRVIYIDSEIPALPACPNGVAGRAGRAGTERDAETEGPEFSSGSIQHDRKRRAHPHC